MHVHLQIVRYQTEAGGPKRYAVSINEGENIVDCETSKVLGEVWDYHPCTYILSVGLELDQEKKEKI